MTCRPVLLRHAARLFGAGAALACSAALSFSCADGEGDGDFTTLRPIDAGGGGLPNPVVPDAATLPPADSGGAPDAAPIDAGDACRDALSTIAFDFESAAGWTHGNSDGVSGSWPFDEWQLGVATTGPACKSGACFGVALTQNYAQCGRAYLVSPPIDLSACSGRDIALVFEHSYQFWTGSYNGATWYDGGVVELSGNGTTWQLAQGSYPGTVSINAARVSPYVCVATPFGVHGKAGFIGTQLAPTQVELEVPPSAITNRTRIRFSYGAGVAFETTNANTSRAHTAPGWRIDDVGFVVR